MKLLSPRTIPLVTLALVGCNALLGIEDATLEHPSDDAGTPGPDTGLTADAAGNGSGDASSDGPHTTSDAKTDGNANDAGSVDAADAEASDASDDAADAGDAGGGGVDASCTHSGPTMASKDLVNYGPAIAFKSNVWGIVWHGVAETIQFNAVDSAGNIQNGSDVTAVPSSPNVSYGAFPRVAAAAGTSLALAYGVKANTGTAATFPAVRTINASTGALVGGPANGVSANDTATSDVGGVAVNSAGSVIATSGRLHSLASATLTWTNFFNSVPVASSADPLTPKTLTTSIAWSSGAARFGMAYVVDSTQTGGQITTYDASGVSKATFAFSASGDAPAAGSSLAREVSIAAAENRFAVAWLDGDPALDVKVTTVDALTGDRLPVGAVQASTGTAPRGFPRIVYDGRTLAIAWVQGASGSEQIYVRRYTPELVPLDAAPWCASCGVGKVSALSAIGLATSGPNDYGLAFMLGSSGTYYQHFTHITCVGP